MTTKPRQRGHYQIEFLARVAQKAVEARIRLELESLVKVSDRYKTLFYGLKRNHPHSAAVVHPLLFLIRRLIYAAIAIFCLSVPIVGVYILSFICVAMISYVLVEQQWEDSLIAL